MVVQGYKGTITVNHCKCVMMKKYMGTRVQSTVNHCKCVMTKKYSGSTRVQSL